MKMNSVQIYWNPNAIDNSMLLVCGKPSNLRNCEVTESFIKKWGMGHSLLPKDSVVYQ
ncbi:hypothetical protein BDV36DRAFT_275766 [Aspergillus pseudocaelatus]|uniref:Uncharacterized protein n=1 Tax=Aspergillus pseudocaelatus TaxID=1825620 RepID=A0ABQ6W1V5_9EURO|nr:hypothetical protein BDV36DRAFT_275766 [Aspergillus pseudocaelatus]